jgi:hypothetical protein
MSAWWTLLRETVARWSDHKDARLGAALAYYYSSERRALDMRGDIPA